ncbi:MAG: hypothetical protein ABIH46_05540 [Chloroflexota bacterium]
MEEEKQKTGTLARRLELELHRPTFQLLLLITAVTLVMLPFVTTFNEFLTAVVMWTGLNSILQNWVVPTEARLVAPFLQLFGLNTAVTPNGLLLTKGADSLVVNISWNCVGWQSFILFAITVITGTQGPYTLGSKFHTVLLGILGTLLLNLFRIATVALVGFFFGRTPAIIYHDYGSTLMVLGWLALFWWITHRYLLEPDDSDLWDETDPSDSDEPLKSNA